MTTSATEIADQTTGSSMTSSSSRGAGFYFQCAVIVIGFVGSALNRLILYALIASKQHKKQVLIFNQNLLDFVSCFFLFTTQAIKLCNIPLSGTRGYWLCVTVLSEFFNWGPFVGSLINLAAISIERYLKVDHAVWAKKSHRVDVVLGSDIRLDRWLCHCWRSYNPYDSRNERHLLHASFL